MTELDLLLRALASPTRLRILALLRAAPRGPAALAATLRLAPSTVTFHLKLLLRMHLVRYQKHQRYKFYTLAHRRKGSLRTRLLERLGTEVPEGLGPVPAHPSRKPGRVLTRPRGHSGVNPGPLGPVWRALTSFSFFRRLLMLKVFHEEGRASVRRLMTAADLSARWVEYHLDKLTRRGVVEESGGIYRLCAKPPTALQGFLTGLLGEQVSGVPGS